MEIAFARGRSEDELARVAENLFHDGFRPYGLPFVVEEFWSVEEARRRRRADVHYLTMARQTPSRASSS